jgi:hypothetical protein
VIKDESERASERASERESLRSRGLVGIVFLFFVAAGL